MLAHVGDVGLDIGLALVNDGLVVPVAGSGRGRGHTVVATIVVSDGACEVQRAVSQTLGQGDITSPFVLVDLSPGSFIGGVYVQLLQVSSRIVGQPFPLETGLKLRARGILFDSHPSIRVGHLDLVDSEDSPLNAVVIKVGLGVGG